MRADEQRGWELGRLALLPLVLTLMVLAAGCGKSERPLAPRSQTWAELRTVRKGVQVAQPGEGARAPFSRERLVDGARVRVEPGGLAWLRRDGGATLLVRGPADLTLYAGSVKIVSGRIFVDTPAGSPTLLEVPSGELSLARVRASLDIDEKGAGEVYVLDGEVRLTDSVRARAGEMLELSPGKEPSIRAASVWQDWTGGLATTDRAALPAPFGVGTVGARPPGELGSPRFPLAIQRLDVNVRIDGDFAVTEVDQRFFNPSSKTVEGIYRFRAPEGASVFRFGVDRGRDVVWGRVKESAAAAAQYQSNVYAGSTEDPALLEWEGPGAYRARLYPIGPGETRRVVVRYSEWLARSGDQGQRRHYVYPMAAEGSEASLPHIEELTVRVELARAGAKDVRVGMAGTRVGSDLIVRAQDFVPRADLSVELFDDGAKTLALHHAKHRPDQAVLAPDARAEAMKAALTEAEYLLIPLRARDVPVPAGGLDVAIVVDASAANDASSMALARAAALGILSHLGDDDRAIVWAGAEALRPVLPEVKSLTKLDASLRQRYSAALATLERGGATDLGAMLSDAALALDPARRGVVVYIGDGNATVGELGLTELEQRLAKLARPPRVFGLGVGREIDMAVLDGLSAGGFATRLDDAHSAARSAIRLLEVAERPAWLGTEVDLGQNVERVYPRNVSALLADETVLVVGRVRGSLPQRVVVKVGAESRELPLALRYVEDHGDLRRRWAQARLDELLATGSGRAAMVDVGTRYGIITPVTSYYVPTRRELEAERPRRAVLDDDEDEPAEQSADNKEGGTGTRAKGEEGSMGSASPKASNKRYAVAGPKDNADPHISRSAALREAQEFGMIGVLNSGASGDPNAPTAPWGRDSSGGERPDRAAEPAAPEAAEDAPAAPAATASPSTTIAAPEEAKKASGNMWGDEIGQAAGAGGKKPPESESGPSGLGLSGIGEGGGGRGEGIGLGTIGKLGHGAGTGTGQGFGSGHGRLGGAQRAAAPRVRMGAVQTTGKLPPEVIQRIVRQNFGRFRLCYEQGLSRNPNLEGRVATRFVIGAGGDVTSVRSAGSDLPDAQVVQCITSGFEALSFPAPEGGNVVVVYPIMLSPGDVRTPGREPEPVLPVLLTIDVLPRVVIHCGAAADLPLAERIALWRERMSRAAGSPGALVNVYRKALAACEAPTWTERRRLLSLMLDALPSVSSRVLLWRLMQGDATAADTLYRGMVARVKTAAQMKELHAALGLKSMDPGLLAKLIKDTRSKPELAFKLRALYREWPDDFHLALALLDALEDAEDFASAREHAERLRSRPDVDAHVRTAVGELYLRLAQKAGSAAQKAVDQASARRAFGEIVEFSPDDPVARRRLGDLLRAHGWYADARRQYETLAKLTPDDTSVSLLLAAAAEGEGQLEAAVRWTEKGRGAGAPDVDSGPAATARAFAATFLAWGRSAAREGKRDKELAALIHRAKSVLAADRATKGTARVTLSWAHPELHPVLYSNALGSPMPAADGDVTLGISQVRLPLRAGAFVEIKIEPDEVEAAARLGAEAWLTVVFDELGKGEKIVRVPVRFERGSSGTIRFAVSEGEVTRG